MKPTKRLKVRNCIRENTYRYYMDSEIFPRIWIHLEKCFGLAAEFGSPHLLQIQTPQFILRSSTKDATITFIQTGSCDPVDLENFHKIIGYLGETT